MDVQVGVGEGENNFPHARSRSSNRMLYEAQVIAIQQQIGGLEEVREKLGLSQRKICQLLMVDPSAWNRWTAEEGSAPPHVWRALQWYFALKKELPGINENYFLSHEMRLRDRDAQKYRINEMLHQLGDLQKQIENLKTENQLLNQDFHRYRKDSKTQIKKIIFFSLIFIAKLGILSWLFFKK